MRATRPASTDGQSWLFTVKMCCLSNLLLINSRFYKDVERRGPHTWDREPILCPNAGGVWELFNVTHNGLIK